MRTRRTGLLGSDPCNRGGFRPSSNRRGIRTCDEPTTELAFWACDAS
jgi:hypothetical protein